MCLQPSTDDEHKKLTDLILRCIFYRALDDEYLQKELCNLKGPDITLQQFFDEAVNAEAKRSNFENTTEKGNSLDPAGAISINKYDYSSRGGNGSRGASSYRGRKGNSRGGGAAAAAARASETRTTNTQPSYNTPNSKNYTPQHGQNEESGKGGKQRKIPTCYTCGIVGHTSNKCYKNSEKSPKVHNNSQVSTKKVVIEQSAQEINEFKADII